LPKKHLLPTWRWPTTFPILCGEFSQRRESGCRIEKTRTANQRRPQVLIVKNDRIHPFRIEVTEEVLGGLRERLKNTRFSYQAEGANWALGTDSDYLRELVRYWHDTYDWRKHETALNRFAHFRTEVDDIGLHFIHERGKGPNPFPIILTHGYPDSFYRFARIIPMLTDPASFGGRPEDSFDVVVPDLPGYGFSDKPSKAGTLFRVNDLWARLMKDRLGYQRFGAHGGDWGSTITEQLARSHSDSVVAIHLTDVPFGHIFQKPDDPSSTEIKYFRNNEKWMQREGAYASIQSTKPQSLAHALNDSPAGLAGWIVEKFRSWSDCHGDLESRFTKDELLTHIMIYWVTESIGSSFLPYYDYANANALDWIKEGMKKWTGSSSVPAAFALFPKDISQPPREWAERFFNVQRWTEMARGGHFAAMEEPELFTEDIRTWFRIFRDGN
jgi:pimeloyl-ACP methyl ester carboxylesterase